MLLYKHKNYIMRKSKIKNVRVMVGSGEHSMFITVPKGKKVMLEDGTFIRAGITSEEARNEFLEKENKIIKDIERKQLKEKVKRRVLSIFNKN